MTEAFLHYVWQFQYFSKEKLQTTTHEPLNILRVGLPNTRDGADFQQAQIKIGEMLWVGSVEIHLTDTAWLQHKHKENAAYNNVILHVVWQKKSTMLMQRADGSEIPTLELGNRISPLLIEKYHHFMQSGGMLPCEKDFEKVEKLTIISMLDNVLVQRLQRKAEQLLKILEKNAGDWEQTTYQWIGQSFGFKANNETFLHLTETLPLKLVQKYSFDLQELEALLFGQAGFLETINVEETATDEYTKNLQIKYKYLQHKHQLVPIKAVEWKFLRLRPANFPTIRLAQFAALLHKQQGLFTSLVKIENYKELKNLLTATASNYWTSHYHFGKSTEKSYENLGTESINGLIINTVAPLLAAYAMQTDNDIFMAKAIRFFEQMPAEKNNITKLWQEIGLPVKTAFDSQASLELYNDFCTKKQCLQCRIGREILK